MSNVPVALAGWIVGATAGGWDALIVALNIAQTLALGAIAARSRQRRRDDTPRDR